MSEPFVGQIMTAAFGFAPRGYALCDGQLLPIVQNQALFALLSDTYGGNGTSNFALPDLRGRAAIGAGASVDPAWQPAPYAQGMSTGVETVALTVPQMPVHSHPVYGSSATGSDGSPSTSQTFGQSLPGIYAPAASLVALAGGPTGVAGANAPHPNMQPSLAVSMAIALTGIWPSRG